MAVLSRHVNTPQNYNLELPGRGTLQDKLYVGFVKVADDVLRMGRLKVWIPELGGDPNDESGWFIVSYCAPFAGATNVYDNRNENTYSSTQKSYGMWFVPPDINNEVVCAFINGDPARGVWLGCLYQQDTNHMVPGLPGQNSTPSTPVAEFNKRLTGENLNSPPRPDYEPLAEGLLRQGLNLDTIRGVSDSGARRAEPANSVYGILTPGGSQLVFDDSPANAYIRLRTKSGAQMMINDTTGFIYLNSVDGKNWISMDATGKIDIYAQDDISIRSQGSLNLRGDIDVNIEAGRDINMRARGRPVNTQAIPNPASNPPPTLPSAGNIVVVGDSIAVGTGQRIQGAIVAATVGDNSTAILTKVRSNDSIKNFVNAIVSAGSNDIVNGQGNTGLLTSNLEGIRLALAARSYIWLLPYDSVAKATVKAFADGKGDQTIDLSNYPTSDNLHPRDYALVANDARSKCIPSPEQSGGAAGGATGAQASGVGQTPYGSYNIGTYRTLPEAEAAAARYRSAAEFARANPQLYPGVELTTVLRFEAAANAEVNRLRSQGQTTPATIQASQPAPTGPVAQNANAPAPTGTTGASTAIPTVDEILLPHLRREEGKRNRAYRDPPDTNLYAVGYGHNMGTNELAPRSTQRSFIDCGSAGQCPILGPNGSETVMTDAQAEGALLVDVRRIAYPSCTRWLRGAWDLLGPYQQAALLSFAYNAGSNGIRILVDNGLTNFINERNIESAAQLIENTITRVRSFDLTRRRRAEANMYRGRPDLAGQGAPSERVDGYSPTNDASVNAYGAPVSSEDRTVVGGYIKIQSRNSMHLLSDQHIFISSAQDLHTLAGNNMFDTAVRNINRAAGGYIHDGSRAEYGLTSNRGIIISAPRTDINGPQPPPPTTAAQAVGPISQRQTDARVNSLGNVVIIQTDTILPHLPYHEPYENHGGRSFENARDATAIQQNTGLRDGEIVPNSPAPLDIYGSPRSDMPAAIYRGEGYNAQNQPLYRFESPISNATIFSANSLVISDDGKQFIKSRENGSYRPIQVGNPPKQEIGYGHTLTAQEISAGSITIKGLTTSLSEPFTQQQINDLFDEDIAKVEQWMKPEIKSNLSQTQYDMFCSLAFSIGENNFKGSAVIRNFNDGNLSKVPNTWMQHTLNGANQVVPQLIARRRAEITKFMAGPASDGSQGSANLTVETTNF